MNLRKPYYLPNGVMAALSSGEIDHIEYDGPVAHLHRADGAVVTISVAVTDEIREAERRAEEEECVRRGGFVGPRMRVTFDLRNWNGVITGWTK